MHVAFCNCSSYNWINKFFDVLEIFFSRVKGLAELTFFLKSILRD